MRRLKKKLIGEDLVEEAFKKVYQGKAIAETVYEYDGNGNIIKVTTPEGYENIMHYDSADRLVR